MATTAPDDLPPSARRPARRARASGAPASATSADVPVASRATRAPSRRVRATDRRRGGDSLPATTTTGDLATSDGLPRVGRSSVLEAASDVVPSLESLMGVSAPSLVPLVGLRVSDGGVTLTHLVPVDAVPLASLRAVTPLRSGQVVTVLAAVGEALVVLHDAGLAHGAVDDEHVLVAPDGSVHLAGCGLAWRRPPGTVDGPSPATDVVAAGALVRHLLGAGTATSGLVLAALRAADEDPAVRPDAEGLLDAVRRSGRAEPLLDLLWLAGLGPHPRRPDRAPSDVDSGAAHGKGHDGSSAGVDDLVHDPSPSRPHDPPRDAEHRTDASESSWLDHWLVTDLDASAGRPTVELPTTAPVSLPRVAAMPPGASVRALSTALGSTRRSPTVRGARRSGDSRRRLGLVAVVTTVLVAVGGGLVARAGAGVAEASSDPRSSLPTSSASAPGSGPAATDPTDTSDVPTTSDELDAGATDGSAPGDVVPARSTSPAATDTAGAGSSPSPSDPGVPTASTPGAGVDGVGLDVDHGAAPAPPWASVLHDVDAGRLRAIASGSVDELARYVDPNGPAFDDDSRLVARVAASGARLHGGSLEVLSVRAERATTSRTVLRVRDRRAAYVVEADDVRTTVRARAPRWWRVTLARSSDGRWRVFEVTAIGAGSAR